MLEHIIESNKIEGVFDDSEHMRSYRAWLWLLKQKTLSREVVLELHRRVMREQLPPSQAGDFRVVNVTVGGRLCPNPSLVPHLLANWLLDYDSMTPIEAHIAFEKCHCFVDGNGRTGRLILWWHQTKKRQQPTLFKDSEKHDVYYPLFN